VVIIIGILLFDCLFGDLLAIEAVISTTVHPIWNWGAGHWSTQHLCLTLEYTTPMSDPFSER
jgi:hypothetical protein